MAKAAAATIGYFTVVEDDNTGWTGGLLLLNQAGRPLEFQCTLPVRPTRAHEILFGVTLREHLINQVIGELLLSKCRNDISMLCCDLPESVALGRVCKFPVVFLEDGETKTKQTDPFAELSDDGLEERTSHGRSATHAQPQQNPLSKINTPGIPQRRDPATAPHTPSQTMELSGAKIRFASRDLTRVQEVASKLSDLPDGAEPFERIREAIKEAQSQIARAPANRPASAA